VKTGHNISPILAVLVVAVTCCGGCSTVPHNGGPSTAEQQQIQQGQQTIVLLRWAATVAGQPYDLNLLFQKRPTGGQISWKNLETGQQDGVSGPFRSPSPEARQACWFYFLLPPGSYEFNCGTGFTRQSDENRNPTRFVLQVPTGVGVIYLGTWQETCQSLTNNPYLPSDPEHAAGCVPEILDESDAARTVVTQSGLGQGATLTTALLQPVSEFLEPGRLAELAPVGLVVSAKAIGDPKNLAHDPAKLSQGDQFAADFAESLALGGYATPFVLLGAPFAAAAAKHQKEVFTTDIAPTIQQVDPIATLRSDLREALASNGVIVLDHDSGAGHAEAECQSCKSVLEITMTHFRLKEVYVPITNGVFRSASLNFALDIGIHAAVTELSSYRRIYDQTYYFSDTGLRVGNIWPARGGVGSQPRPLDGYRGEEGHEFLRQEIVRALQLTAGRVADNLRGNK
jgi:hypothetical protein